MGLFSNSKIDRLIAKVNELQEALNQKQTELNEALSSTRAYREEARVARAELGTLRDESRESLKREQDKLRSARDARDHHRARVTELEGSLQEKIDQLARTQTLRETAEEKVTALQGVREQLIEQTTEVKRLTRELNSAERALEREPHEIDLHNKVFDLTETNERLKDQVSRLKMRVKSLESERINAQRSEKQEKIKLEAKVRELNYRLEIEDRLYTIQQLELESALSRAKGAEQRFEIKTREAIAEANAEALTRVDAELRKELTQAQAQVTKLEEELKTERRAAFFQPQVVIAEVVEESPQSFAPSSMTEEDWSKVEAAQSVEEAPVEEAPVEEASVEEAPVEEAPVEEDLT